MLFIYLPHQTINNIQMKQTDLPSDYCIFAGKLKGFIFYRPNMERIYTYELFHLGYKAEEVFTKLFYAER